MSAPAHVHDPMTMVLRENAIQANLIRWDDARDRYVLTGVGRRRIATRGRASGAVIAFRRRDLAHGGATREKPAKTRAEE